MTWFESPTTWYCTIVLFIGTFALWCIFRFGRYLADQSILGSRYEWMEIMDRFLNYASGIGFRANLPRHFVDSNKDFLLRRNEFWTTYLQVVVAVLIVIILALLLLTKAISAEAGLPILSAVAGFAISKSISTNSSANTEGNQDRQG
ncbi:MAG TPA: hypothetical protein VFT46_04045 [Holophagaceae bacterium]|nr:hypothetical protein [Holophagaceae bacterium]